MCGVGKGWRLRMLEHRLEADPRHLGGRLGHGAGTGGNGWGAGRSAVSLRHLRGGGWVAGWLGGRKMVHFACSVRRMWCRSCFGSRWSHANHSPGPASRPSPRQAAHNQRVFPALRPPALVPLPLLPPACAMPCPLSCAACYARGRIAHRNATLPPLLRPRPAACSATHLPCWAPRSRRTAPRTPGEGCGAMVASVRCRAAEAQPMATVQYEQGGRQRYD